MDVTEAINRWRPVMQAKYCVALRGEGCTQMADMVEKALKRRYGQGFNVDAEANKVVQPPEYPSVTRRSAMPAEESEEVEEPWWS